MIYKVSAINMPAVFSKGGNIIVMSNDMIYGLVENLTNVENINVEASYNDNELESLLALPEWQKG